MQGLIYNSFAYDLGIQKEAEIQRLKADPAALKAKIDELSKRFTTVIITDYMEESLLLLKRENCWQLDDVVIGAMKVGVWGLALGSKSPTPLAHGSESLFMTNVVFQVTPRAPGSPEPPMKTRDFYAQDPLFQNVIEYNWLDTAL